MQLSVGGTEILTHSSHLVFPVISPMVAGLGQQVEVYRACVAVFWYSQHKLLFSHQWTCLDTKVLNL